MLCVCCVVVFSGYWWLEWKDEILDLAFGENGVAATDVGFRRGGFVGEVILNLWYFLIVCFVVCFFFCLKIVWLMWLMMKNGEFKVKFIVFYVALNVFANNFTIGVVSFFSFRGLIESVMLMLFLFVFLYFLIKFFLYFVYIILCVVDDIVIFDINFRFVVSMIFLNVRDCFVNACFVCVWNFFFVFVFNFVFFNVLCNFCVMNLFEFCLNVMIFVFIFFIVLRALFFSVFARVFARSFAYVIVFSVCFLFCCIIDFVCLNDLKFM